MKWHVFAFTASLGNSAALQALAAINDPLQPPVGGAYSVPIGAQNLPTAPPLSRIVAAYGLGTTIGRVQLFTPSLSQLYLPEMSPLDKGVTIPSSPSKLVTFFDNPLIVNPTEQLSVNVRQDAVGAEQELVALWLADQKPTPYVGPMSSVRFTATPTTAAYVWTTGIPIVFEQALKAGWYQIAGLRVKSATGVLFRLLIPGEYYRFGGVCADVYSNLDPGPQRFGRMGIWGMFNNTSLPSLELLTTGIDSAAEGVIDLVGPFAQPPAVTQ